MLDKLIKREQEEIVNLKAPDDMEDKMRLALGDLGKKDSYRKKKPVFAAVVALIMVVSALNSNGIADWLYREDKSIEIDDYSELISSDNLRNLLDEGYGQKIDREYKFNDGGQIYVEGILLDDVNLMVFTKSKGLTEDEYIGLELLGRGKLLNSTSSSISMGDNSVYEIDIRNEKDILKDGLQLRLTNKKTGESGLIDLNIDYDKKLDSIETININETIRVDGYRLRLKRAYITPLSIRIECYTENIFELGLRTLFGDRMKNNNLDMSLIINGEEMYPNIESFSTDLAGSYFHVDYKDLPREIKKVDIKINKVGDIEIKRVINIK